MSTRVFVDDSDPQIKYIGAWTPLQGLLTANASMITNGYSPTYGTLHAAPHSKQNASSAEFGRISYSFVGTDFRAQFAPGPSSTSQLSCSVDGVQQPIYSAADGSFCVNNGTLSEKNHTLLLGVQSSDVLFDYIWYMTSDPNREGGVDVLYTNPDQVMPDSRLSNPYDTFYFPFYGQSLGIYGTIPAGLPVSALPWTYRMDFQGDTVGFYTTYSNQTLGTQLLLQTPHNSSGQHEFVMTFMGPRISNTTSISIDRIIVQNSASSANITAFPSSQYATVTDAFPFGEDTDFDFDAAYFHPEILGGIWGSFLFVCIVAGVVVWRVLRRKGYSFNLTVSPPASTVQPFWQGHSFQYQYTSSDRPGKGSSHLASSNGSSTPTSIPPPTHPDTSVLYMVHQDGGQMSSTMEPDGRVVVELPPDYNAISGPSTARTSSSAVEEEQVPVVNALTLSNNPDKGSNVYRLK